MEQLCTEWNNYSHPRKKKQRTIDKDDAEEESLLEYEEKLVDAEEVLVPAKRIKVPAGKRKRAVKKRGEEKEVGPFHCDQCTAVVKTRHSLGTVGT